MYKWREDEKHSAATSSLKQIGKNILFISSLAFACIYSILSAATAYYIYIYYVCIIILYYVFYLTRRYFIICTVAQLYIYIYIYVYLRWG